MCDDDIHQGLVEDPTVSRRTFGLMGVAAAGLANLIRLQTGMWSFPQVNKLFAFLPNIKNALWPLMVNPRYKFLRDSSKWTTANWRMDEALDAHFPDITEFPDNTDPIDTPDR